MRERNWDSITRDEAARIIMWFDHTTFRDIIGPLLLGEKRHNTDMALYCAVSGKSPVETAVYAACAGFVDKVLAYEETARGILSGLSDGASEYNQESLSGYSETAQGNISRDVDKTPGG